MLRLSPRPAPAMHLDAASAEGERNRLRGGRPVATEGAVRRAKSAQRGFREKVFSGKKF
jgi:hypothetical protein